MLCNPEKCNPGKQSCTKVQVRGERNNNNQNNNGMLCNPGKQQKSCTKEQVRGEKNNMIGFSYRDVVFDGIDEVK